MFLVELPKLIMLFLCAFRKGWSENQNWGTEENYQHDTGRRQVAQYTDDHHSFCASPPRSHHQEITADFLGNRSQNNCRWQASAGNDPGVWCLQKGPPTPKWVPAWVYLEVPVQVEGAWTPWAFNASHPRLSWTQTFLRPEKCCSGHIHHFQVRFLLYLYFFNSSIAMINFTIHIQSFWML